jgi:hypothetical protein
MPDFESAVEAELFEKWQEAIRIHAANVTPENWQRRIAARAAYEAVYNWNRAK